MARVKGTNFIGLVKVLRSQRERARELVDVTLYRYLEDRVLPSSWYPADDFLALQRAVAALMPPSVDPYYQMGKLSAQNDLGGIYKICLKPGDAQRTLASASVLWRNYHDTGELRVEAEGAKAAVVVWRDYPEATRQLCVGTRAYVTEMVKLSGAKNVRLVEVSCRVDGAKECRWRLTWD